MSDIKASHPEYRETSRLDELRTTEYGYLDEDDHLYLDYTGAGLAARAQYSAHEARLSRTAFGNPHSTNPTSEAATGLVERARARVLQHLNASPDEYAAIFTPNATGAARLIAEAYPFRRRSRLVMTFDNHNSVNGIREYARRAGAGTVYVPAQPPDLRVSTDDVVSALSPQKDWWMGCRWPTPSPRRRMGWKAKAARQNGLFAYPAQSNFSGVRHPLSWISMAQEQGYDVLLDAAAYLPTAELDLSVVKPDFVLVSWYKVFGYPTGVGCLVARRDALARLRRPWFSGGTVRAVTVGRAARTQWHMLNRDESAFEDGTVNFLSIPDVHFGLDWLSDVGMSLIATRVRCLTSWFLTRLLQLEHTDGTPMARVYGPTNMKLRGGTVCFNLIDAAGELVDDRLVAIESAASRISLRTGCFCNPGGGEDAFGIDAATLRRAHGIRSVDLPEAMEMLGVPTLGAIRVSFGLASTEGDVNRFFDFVEATYRDRITTKKGLPPRGGC